MPGASDLSGGLEDGEGKPLLGEPGPRYQSADPRPHHYHIVSAGVLNEDVVMFAPVMMVAGEESQAGEQDEAEGGREGEVEEVADTGEQQAGEQEVCHDLLQLEIHVTLVTPECFLISI